jgi:hypothetical protein
MRKMTFRRLGLAVSTALFAAAFPARAQLAGNLVKGQYGLAAGTQVLEGLVLTGFVYDAYSTQLVGPDGKVVQGTTGSLNLLAVPGVNLWYVSPLKILGANYGAVLSFWGSGSRAEVPRLGSEQSTYGFGDMYLKPVELGWHTTYVDVITGFALWIPTGRYALGANNNTGTGQWGYEFSLGATVWLDKDHHFNISTQALYDIYSPKNGDPIGPSNTRVQTGNILNLQGGIGYQFLDGAMNVGIPYFVQWKVTEDTLPSGIGPILPGLSAAKAWDMGLGIEANFFWSASDGVTFRFVQSFAGSNTTNGSVFFFAYNHIFHFADH